MSELLIKNMVCPRCVMVVKEVMNKLDIPFEKVELGKVVLPVSLDQEHLSDVEIQLQKLGFGLVKGPEERLIENIKNKLHELFQREEMPTSFSLGQYLTEEISQDYSKMSHLFSVREGVTIEKYFIKLKLEKVKELLFNQELQLSEIAWKLGYSSIQHLSGQFKKVMGMTPSAYKKLKEKPRTDLDKVR